METYCWQQKDVYGAWEIGNLFAVAKLEKL